MNEESQKPVLADDTAQQLVKQLKRLNRWVTFFGMTFLVAFALLVYLLVQVFLFVRTTGESFQNFQQTTTEKLDVKNQLCEGTDTFSTWLKTSTNACE